MSIVLLVIFLVLTLALYFVGRSHKKSAAAKADTPSKAAEHLRMRTYCLLGAGVFFLICIWIVFSAFIRTVPNGKVAVAVLFGKTQNAVLTPGLNLVNPLSELVEMNTLSEQYTASGSAGKDEQVDDGPIQIQGNDGLGLNVEVSVLYRLDPQKAPKLYREVGLDYEAKIIRPEIRSIFRTQATKYTGINLYMSPRGEREQLAQEVFQELQKAFKKRDIILENVLVRNVNAPGSIVESINAKKTAEQDALRMESILESERKEAERKKIEAQGIADYQRITSQGISEQMLKWKGIEATEALARSENAKIVVIGGKDGLPLILNQ